MYFTSQFRHNPATGEDEFYYRLKVSYRDIMGVAQIRIVMKIGFVPSFSHEEIGTFG